MCLSSLQRRSYFTLTALSTNSQQLHNSPFALVPDVGRFRRGHRDLIAPRFTRCELRLLAFCHLPPTFLTLENRENAALPSPIASATITLIKALAVFLEVNIRASSVLLSTSTGASHAHSATDQRPHPTPPSPRLASSRRRSQSHLQLVLRFNMDDRFTPSSAHSDEMLAQNLHDPIFEPQPSFNFADSQGEDQRGVQPTISSPHAPIQPSYFDPGPR